MMNILKAIEKSPHLKQCLGGHLPKNACRVQRCDILWAPEGYTRQRLFKSPKVEVVLLAWDAHAASPIHDHPNQYGFMYVLEGQLIEDTYLLGQNKLLHSKSRKIPREQCQYIPTGDNIHRIKSPVRSVSVHFYFPPKDHCYIYNMQGERQIKYLDCN